MSRRTRLQTFATGRGTVSDLDFNPTGTRMALVDEDGADEVWDVENAVRVSRAIDGAGASGVVGFTPDGYVGDCMH